MHTIKFFLLILIFLASTFIGKIISKKYTYRLEELEEIKNALNMFKTKIKFTYEPIPQIFGEIATNCNKNIGNIFSEANKKMVNNTASVAWEEAVEEASTNLKKEDKSILKTLSKLLRPNRFRADKYLK